MSALRLEEETSQRVQIAKQLQARERELQQCRNHIDEYVKEQEKLEERIAQFVTDVQAYQDQADADRSKLEAEMVARVNAQNNCQSLREEITFTSTIHSQVSQVAEICTVC